MSTLPPFELKAFFNQPAAATARANLSPSFAEPLGTAELLALEPDAAERLTTLPLGYTAAFGGAELRAAIAARHRVVAPEQVLAGCGADDVLGALFMALLAPGDEVVVQHPVYQPLTSIAGWRGADVVRWEGEEDAGWEPSLDSLARLLRPSTRMIVVNLPHSPTGFVAGHDWLARLIALAEDAGTLLVVDEIYRGLPLDDAPEAPSAADLSASAVVLDSVSKVYGLPGLRVGWLATRNAAVLDAVRAFRLHGNSFLPAPAELLATIALRHGDTLLARQRRLARDNAELLAAFLARHPAWFACVLPRAGVVAYPRWLGGPSTRSLSDALLRDHRLLLAPSAAFAGDDHHVRLGFGTASFPAALALLEEALASLAAA